MKGKRLDKGQFKGEIYAPDSDIVFPFRPIY
jgi:hypothetical protein